MYSLQILDAAAHDLSGLDRQVASRVVKRLRWLAENLESIKPQPLSRELAGFCKFRVGDYRSAERFCSTLLSMTIAGPGDRRTRRISGSGRGARGAPVAALHRRPVAGADVVLRWNDDKLRVGVTDGQGASLPYSSS